jgi:hypothetical protein
MGGRLRRMAGALAVTRGDQRWGAPQADHARKRKQDQDGAGRRPITRAYGTREREPEQDGALARREEIPPPRERGQGRVRVRVRVRVR